MPESCVELENKEDDNSDAKNKRDQVEKHIQVFERDNKIKTDLKGEQKRKNCYCGVEENDEKSPA